MARDAKYNVHMYTYIDKSHESTYDAMKCDINW